MNAGSPSVRSGRCERRDRLVVLSRGRCLGEVGQDRALLQAAGLADRADPLDPAVAGLRLGAQLGLAHDHEEGHRLRELRASTPLEVLVTAPEHPLAGTRLAVEGRTTVGGVRCLIVRLPDGTPGTIAVAATSAGVPDVPAATGALLSADAVRLVRRLLDAVGEDRSGT